MLWAEHHFELMQTKDGVTYYEMLKDIERRSNTVIEDLKPPCEFPNLLSHIWAAFLRLNKTRKGGFSGPEPISYTEIKAYIELSNHSLDSWEVDAIIELDQIYLRVSNG